MLIPYDPLLGLHPQAEGFLEHQPWDFEATSPEQYPLLLHFPYFELYRKQVVKQADLVLAMFLCGDAFTPEQKARNFDYYERLTVRDSSLSACTQAVIAAEVGHLELAYDYFGEAALMDLDDLEHNTRDGLHIASLAGTWIAAVAGFGGMRDHGERSASRLDFPRGSPGSRSASASGSDGCSCEVTHEHATYSLLEGSPLEVVHHGKRVTVESGRALTAPIPPAPTREAPSQPRGRAPDRRGQPR